jgi:hypothetical protein
MRVDIPEFGKFGLVARTRSLGGKRKMLDILLTFLPMGGGKKTGLQITLDELDGFDTKKLEDLEDEEFDGAGVA